MALMATTGSGACIVARDENGNMVGFRQPQMNIFADFVTCAKADVTVSEWQGDKFNITAKIRHYSID